MAFLRGQLVPKIHDSVPRLQEVATALSQLSVEDEFDADLLWFFLNEAHSDQLYTLGLAIAEFSPLKQEAVLDVVADFAQANDENVQDSVARLLSVVKGDKAKAVLQELLARSSSSFVRYTASRGLHVQGAVDVKDE